MSQISFKTSKEDHDLIKCIVKRAVDLWWDHGHRLDVMKLTMDITACHANGCPLKLADLYVAKDADFTHDIGGIMRHIDRSTGHLGDCFLPRYADTSGMVKQ